MPEGRDAMPREWGTMRYDEPAMRWRVGAQRSTLQWRARCGRVSTRAGVGTGGRAGVRMHREKPRRGLRRRPLRLPLVLALDEHLCGSASRCHGRYGGEVRTG